MRFFSNAGAPAVGYKLYTYAAGTTTPKAAFRDAAGLVPHENPITLNANGESCIYWDGNYRVDLKSPAGVSVTDYPVDNFETVSNQIGSLTTTLAGPGGADSVGFQQLGIGAIPRTSLAKMRGERTSEDYSANPVTGAAAAAAAIKILEGGAFSAGGSAYVLANLSPIKVTGGVGYAVEYDHRYAKVTSPNTSTNAFEFSNAGSMIAGSYRNEYTIRNIVAVGAGKTGTSAGIKQIDAANIRIQGALVQGFSKGLHLYSGLSSSYYDMTITGNSWGVYAEGGAPLTLAEPNANSFYGCRIYGNDRAVEYIGGANAAVLWCGTNFEGNNLAGNAADGRAIVNLQLTGQQTFIATHHEGNLGQYGIRYNGADQGKTMTMLGVEHIDGTDTQVEIMAGCFLGLGSRIFGNTSTKQLNFATGASGTIIECETTPSGDLSNLAVMRFGKLRFGGNPVTSSACISATAEAVNNAAGGTVTEFLSDSMQHVWKNAANVRMGYIGFYNASDHDLVADGTRGWNFWSNGAKIASAGRLGTLSFDPGVDNARTLGSAALRWSTVYAAVGAINTSDEREKLWRGDLTAPELAAASEIAKTIGAYQWLSSIAEKGQDGARLHVGVKAQQVFAIMAKHGLDAMRYGFACYDKWDASAPAEPLPADSERVTAEPIQAGDRYGIRPDQLAFFIAAAQEQRLAALESMVSP